ncbi:MAG: hypothetical protein FJX60_07795 [Alphaproteobacteria bacterium]|nr:hypothetical protein [Alphaproteobacteria bacterium]
MKILRVLLVFGFLITAVTATFGIWNGLVHQGPSDMSLIKTSIAADPGKAPKAAAAEPAPEAAPPPAPVSTSSQSPSSAPPPKESASTGGKQSLGDAPVFEPLDLTPGQAALLEQALAYGQAVRRREETIALRERALAVARQELERRLDLAKKTIEQASASQRAAVEAELEGKRRELQALQAEVGQRESASQRAAVEAELEGKRRELQALQAEVGQREESLKALAAKIREDATQKTEKTIAAYRSMKPKKVAAVLSQMDAVEAATVLYLLPDEQRAKVVSELDPAIAGALLRTPFASELAKLTTAAQ